MNLKEKEEEPKKIEEIIQNCENICIKEGCNNPPAIDPYGNQFLVCEEHLEKRHKALRKWLKKKFIEYERSPVLNCDFCKQLYSTENLRSLIITTFDRPPKLMELLICPDCYWPTLYEVECKKKRNLNVKYNS